MGYLKRKPDRGRWREHVQALNAEGMEGSIWEGIPNEPPRAPCFVRFATRELHPLSGRRSGLFTASYMVLNSRETDEHDAALVRAALDWFNEHLAGPELDDDRVVFLFKSEASECMRRIWILIHVLRDVGVWGEMQVLTNPGRIVYEDEHQVAVVPWAESTTL